MVYLIDINEDVNNNTFYVINVFVYKSIHNIHNIEKYNYSIPTLLNIFNEYGYIGLSTTPTNDRRLIVNPNHKNGNKFYVVYLKKTIECLRSKNITDILT
jgi:hypothetical protein